MLKGYSSASLHIQNAVLYVVGAVLNFGCFIVQERRSGSSLAVAFFDGYTAPVFGLILCQALLGLVVSAVLKYADTLVRTSAAACSTCILYLITVLMFGAKFNLTALVGSVVVFVATYIYLTAAPRAEPPAPAKAARGAENQVPSEPCDTGSKIASESLPAPVRDASDGVPKILSAQSRLLFLIIVVLTGVAVFGKLSQNSLTRHHGDSFVKAHTNFDVARPRMDTATNIQVLLVGDWSTAVITLDSLRDKVVLPLQASLGSCLSVPAGTDPEPLVARLNATFTPARLDFSLWVPESQGVNALRPFDGAYQNAQQRLVIQRAVKQSNHFPDWIVLTSTVLLWTAPHPAVGRALGHLPDVMLPTVVNMVGLHVVVKRAALVQVAWVLGNPRKGDIGVEEELISLGLGVNRLQINASISAI